MTEEVVNEGEKNVGDEKPVGQEEATDEVKENPDKEPEEKEPDDKVIVFKFRLNVLSHLIKVCFVNRRCISCVGLVFLNFPVTFVISSHW